MNRVFRALVCVQLSFVIVGALFNDPAQIISQSDVLFAASAVLSLTACVLFSFMLFKHARRGLGTLNICLLALSIMLFVLYFTVLVNLGIRPLSAY